MLVYQRSVGGWPKAVHEHKVDYAAPLPPALRAATLADAGRPDATIDNNATTREIRYLVTAAARTHNGAYQRAAERGVRYLLRMQQPSGGFPQYYPDSSLYRAQITYNDNAMVNALRVLQAVAARQGDYALLDAALAEPARLAVGRGVQCILATQYRQRGRLTAWCAQHDRRTLLPCAARAFELPSLSGDETVGIVAFLLSLEQPTPAVRQAIEAAVAWLNDVQMPNLALQEVTDPRQPSGRDHLLVPQPGHRLWARFYDLTTNQPFYVGRDGVKRAHLADIENERRVGYAYVGTWPEQLLTKEYPRWLAKEK
ncbi:pectate lyase [Hymenobacter sp. RP-2-7]|uniref:Pectate lyase n=2 Tax=Hymenobacter polaris TaxID=2682546 RepID=A0A7Y0AAD0_9BACT|nr:pectate lyase [Hymenobacter polaris]